MAGSCISMRFISQSLTHLRFRESYGITAISNFLEHVSNMKLVLKTEVVHTLWDCVRFVVSLRQNGKHKLLALPGENSLLVVFLS